MSCLKELGMKQKQSKEEEYRVFCENILKAPGMYYHEAKKYLKKHAPRDEENVKIFIKVLDTFPCDDVGFYCLFFNTAREIEIKHFPHMYPQGSNKVVQRFCIKKEQDENGRWHYDFIESRV